MKSIAVNSFYGKQVKYHNSEKIIQKETMVQCLTAQVMDNVDSINPHAFSVCSITVSEFLQQSLLIQKERLIASNTNCCATLQSPTRLILFYSRLFESEEAQ